MGDSLSEFDISIISTPYFTQPSKSMGSVEKVSFQRFSQLKRYGYKVNFIAPMAVNSIIDTYSIRQVRPSTVPDNRNLIRWMYSTRSFDYFTPYMKVPKEKTGKLIFFDGWRLEPWNFLPLQMKFRYSKVINILHPPVIFIDRLPVRIFAPLYKRSIWGALNSRIHKHYLDKGYNSIYLPNGIDIPAKGFIENNSDEFLIFFGRIEPSKAPHLAIKLARKLEIPLKIYGRIYDSKYYKSMIQPYLDPGKIIFCGEVSYEELFKNLKRARATVYFSSSYDPLPTVLLESISFGVPVIGYAENSLSGFHDVIIDRMNGLLIKPTDIDSNLLPSKFINILDGINRTDVYTRTKETWSWENIITQHYKQVIDEFLME